MKIQEPKDRIIFALDVSSTEEAQKLVSMLKPHVGMFKIGLELINTMLAEIISQQTPKDAMLYADKIWELFLSCNSGVFYDIFWDGKFHDIPRTMAGATRPLDRMRIRMFNVHASAGIEGMKEAVAHKGAMKALAVTILTSFNEKDVERIYGQRSSIFKVMQFARDAVDVGMDGIICSPKELVALRQSNLPKGFLKVTPGVRPNWASQDDQKRVMTPAEAIKAGADYLVIGAPIRKPPAEIGTPVDAAKKIAEEIAEALEEA